MFSCPRLRNLGGLQRCKQAVWVLGQKAHHLLGPRARAAQGWPRAGAGAAGGSGSTASPPFTPRLPPGQSGGRAGARTRGRRHGGPEGRGAARRWNAVFSGERDFAPEWRIVWGGVSHGPLLPTRRAPFQALSGSFPSCALKFKEQRGACAAGRDNGGK